MRSIQASIRTGFHIPLALCIGLEQQERGVLPVKGNIEERAVELAQYIIENRATVRSAAAKFGISKSTVHTVVTIRVGFIG